MIDTHLHILPGIDDGPETIEEALVLARTLVQEGIHTAIATPHYNDLFPKRSATDIRERVAGLQRVLDQQRIQLRLLSGHEALITPGLAEDIQTGRLATLNGSRYLLLELWNNARLPETERVIFDLRISGIVPVLAHPERYRMFQEKPNLLDLLMRQGVLLQITASSLVGMQGRKAQRTAEILLKQGRVHCIASDAHGLRKRPPALLQSLKRAVQIVGNAKTQQLIEDGPSMIIKNMLMEVQKYD